MKYDECYKAHKRASQKIDPLPHPLLVSLAGYYLDQEPAQYHEAEKLLTNALEQERSIEAVVLMRSLCKEKGDEKQFLYWSKVLEDLEKKRAYMQKKWPEFLEEQQIVN